MKSGIRNFIIIAVVLVIAYVGYRYYFSGSSASTAGALQTTTTTTAADGSTATTTTADTTDTATNDSSASGTGAVGQDLLTSLDSIDSITIDDSIFTNPAFTLLQDFNKTIPPDTDPGRPDPFASLGVDGAAVSTQVSTSNPSSVTTTTSTLNGALTVGGADVTRWFEYGTTNALGTTTAGEVQAMPGTFSETITGLTPNTTYYVKAAASIGGIIVGGNLVTWTTAQGGTQQNNPAATPAKPAAGAGAAKPSAGQSATLQTLMH